MSKVGIVSFIVATASLLVDILLWNVPGPIDISEQVIESLEPLVTAAPASTIFSLGLGTFMFLKMGFLIITIVGYVVAFLALCPQFSGGSGGR